MAVINYNVIALLGSAVELAALNPVLQSGQLGKEVDTGLFKIGDGVLNWNSISYHVTNNTLSVFMGPSTDAGNLITNSPDDGGLVLNQSTLNSEAEVIGVLDGTLSLADRVAYAANKQQHLASLLLTVYTKRLAAALGTNFTTVFSGAGYTGTSIQESLTTLQTAVDALTVTQTGLIDDTLESVTKTWSSSKIASSILTSVQALRNQLVGNAGEALDTIYELADAMASNSNYMTTLLDEVSKSVKVTAQTLTIEQKLQARANIAAADANLVGNYAEIGDQTLTSVLGAEPGVGETPSVSLGELATRTTALEIKTHMFNCSMYKTGLDTRTGQYTVIQWKRQDGSLAATSTLSIERTTGEGLYTRRTEVFYAADGTTVTRTVVYALTYDNQGVLVSEVIQSVT